MTGPARDERELFGAAVRRAVEAHAEDGAGLDAALRVLGWHDALAADARLAITALFECQGAVHATSSALGHVMRAGLGPYVDPLAAPDEGTVAVVLPALGRWDPPGTVAGGLVVDGLGGAGLAAASLATVPARGGDGDVVVVVPIGDLAPAPVAALDPWMGLTAVHARQAAKMSPVSLAPVSLAPGAWDAAVDLARLALAHELVGAAAAMLALARAHALARVQFGRPIAAFQAVRHRLADTVVSVEGARAVLDAAWEHPSADAAATAKATAGRAARTAARHAQQVLAGMGFTTEHPLHRYVRRVLVLDELFGSARALTAALGRDVLARRRLPPPLAL